MSRPFDNDAMTGTDALVMQDHGTGKSAAAQSTSAPSPVTIAMLNIGEGGAQRAMVNLANHLAAKGHPVRMLVGDVEGTYLAQLETSVCVVKIGPGFGRMIRTMMRELKHGNAPAILATQIKPVFASAIAKAIGGARARLVFRPPNRMTVKTDSLRLAVAQKFTRLLYRKGDGFIAVSGAIADDLTEMGIDRAKIFTIPNGVDLSATTLRSQEPVDDKWLVPGAPPVVMGMGRLTEQKGFDVLLKAMAQVHAVRPDARLMILGEGELRDDLKRLANELGIADIVRMPGFLANPHAYLAQARLFVLPSRWEGSPNALLEALACGCSVVSADCPSGPREILSRGDIGRLVPVDDVEQHARAIIAALDEPTDPKRQKEFIADNFGMEQWANCYLAALHQPSNC